MVIQRLLRPASKLPTTRLWHTTTLASELSLQDADEDDLYGAMDWLLQRQNRIEKKLARRHLAEGDHVLYDLSSSYYEGHTCSLMRFGHSRDGKRGRPIVVYGVMADAAGCPVAVQAYPGNTGGSGHGAGSSREVASALRVGAGGAGGGPGAADRDSDQASEAPSGTGLDLSPAP